MQSPMNSCCLQAKGSCVYGRISSDPSLVVGGMSQQMLAMSSCATRSIQEESNARPNCRELRRRVRLAMAMGQNNPVDPTLLREHIPDAVLCDIYDSGISNCSSRLCLSRAPPKAPGIRLPSTSSTYLQCPKLISLPQLAPSLLYMRNPRPSY